MTVGEKPAADGKAAVYTQVKLAKALGFSFLAISTWERNEREA